MSSRFINFTTLLLIAPVCWGQGADRINRDQNPTTIIGPRNLPLHVGAQELIAGNDAEGVRLTLEGLSIAQGNREHEAALSNLCAGYTKLRLYDKALTYCNMLLERNDRNWRGYNNRAVIYIMTKRWELADADLKRGEELRPGASTIKVARAMYMDAVHPVAPEVEIDDRRRQQPDQQDENEPQQ
jgi:tetratricopeptide (TPR) repeat protein